MSIRIPEGKTLVRRGPGVALALLEAAERIGADRQTSVRTTSGGYHVDEAVAAEYLSKLEPVEDGESRTTDNTEAITSVSNTDSGNGPTESSAAVVNNADAGSAAHTEVTDATAGLSGDGTGQGNETADVAGGESAYPEGAPEATWTHEQLDAWQADPKVNTKGVEWESGTKKSDKLALINK